jgi:transcription antitermination factor NusA-like protein
MTTPAEDAVLRAKAIAARLTADAFATEVSPTTHPVTTETTTRPAAKRKRWGVVQEPIPAAATTTMTATMTKEMLPGLADAAKRLKQTTEPVTRRIWAPTSSERSEVHFFSYLSPRLPNLPAEIISKVYPHAASAEDGGDSREVKIELKGRGSSKNPPPPGMPEEPMHILITGVPDVVNMAEIMVESLLAEAESSPVEVPDPTSLKNETPSGTDHAEGGMSTAITTIPTRNSTSGGYRPATVAQLIANAPTGLAGVNADALEEKIGVPNGVVGYLIGRGGENISSMQSRSGCKIQIQKEHELQPGQTLRVITLSAATQDSIDQCRGMIESMVQDRVRAAGGSNVSSSTTTSITPGVTSVGVQPVVVTGSASKEVKVNEALAAGHVLLQVQVPDADVGLIIGKSGMTIKHIQDTTGASIQIPPTGNPDDPTVRTVSITHPREQGAEQAKRQIEGLLKSKPSYASSQGAQVTIQIMVGGTTLFRAVVGFSIFLSL